MTQYAPSVVVSADAQQDLAAGFPLGKRFKSVNTVRVADAVNVHIGHHHRADGRFRVYAFADKDHSQLNAWAEWMLNSPESPVKKFTPTGADIDSVLDVKVVYQEQHHDVAIETVPKLFLPASGPYGLTDYEKIYAAIAEEDIFALREINRDGVIVVVRPDHYVSHILPMSARGELTEYFAQFMKPQA